MESRKLKKWKWIIIGVVIVIIAFVISNYVKVHVIEGIGRTRDGVGYRVQGDEVTITDYNGKEKRWLVPSEIKGRPVTAIGDDPKNRNRFSAEYIEIPDGVMRIVELSFKFNLELKEVRMSDTVKEIGWGAFDSCVSLEEINLSKGLEILEGPAFSGCSSLKTISIPEKVTRIEALAFEGCTSLETVILPESLTFLGASVFRNCVSLKEIIIPAKVEDVEARVFKDCINLEKIEFQGQRVKGINKETFENTRWLENQKATEEFIIVAGNLIEYNGNEKEVTIPESVKVISEMAFESCDNLEKVVIPSTVEIIDENAFQWCPNLKTVSVGEGIKQIKMWAFYDCENLQNLIFEGQMPENEGDDITQGEPERITVYGKDGTGVEEFALENGFKFKKLDENGNIPEI